MCNTWPTEPPQWSAEAYEELMKDDCKDQIPKVTLQQLMDNSERFPVKYHVESVRCRNLIKDTPENALERNINSAYPVVHEAVLNLYSQFLEHKRKFGTPLEKELYKNMTLDVFIDRLLTKRAAVFLGGPGESYMLLDAIGRSSWKWEWEKIGTLNEEEPLVLKNNLSYDEIKLSALLSVSSYTEFINVGDRNNCGKIDRNPDKIERNGVVIGVTGTRLGKKKVMEYQEIVVNPGQNRKENGYGDLSTPTVKSLFLNFYGEPSLTYEELQDQFNNKNKYTELKRGYYFNNFVYEKRLALSVDTLLIEANARAEAVGNMAFVHVVGFGLGARKISEHQNAIFMDTFAKRIEFLSSTLCYISGICFSHITHSSCGKYRNGDMVPIEKHKNNGIRIHIYDRDPHEKLEKPYEGDLLVVSYACDGNALPGNEFWWGHLDTSGAAAAACSTQIAEIHNPHINPRVCGANLMVTTLTGLITLGEYKGRIRKLHDESYENVTSEGSNEN